MILQAYGIQRREGIAILIFDDIAFNINEIMRKRWAFHNDKGDSESRRQNTLIYTLPIWEHQNI